MYDIPEEYYYNKILNKSNLIPNEETARNKKLIRDNLIKARLGYQIEGEAVPSYQTDEYNISVIMVVHIEIKDIRRAEILNKIFQKLFKVFLMIRFTDNKDNVRFGLGYKRLSKSDKNEIVLDDSFVTKEYAENFLDDRFDYYKEVFNYNNIINKFNKLSFYTEAMVKAYILDHLEDIVKHRAILGSKIWFSQTNMLEVYRLLNKMVAVKEKSKKANLTKEKIEHNKVLVKLNNKLEEIING